MERIMAEIELLGAAPSNYVWAVRIALAEKGVPYRHISAVPHTAEVDAIHPFGKIPVLRHGDVVLAESRAICGYLDAVFDGPRLIPADPMKAAKVEQWISIGNTHIDPVWIRQYVGAYVFPRTADGAPDRARIELALPRLTQDFPVMDRAVAGGYLAGDSFSFADMNFLPILHYMSKFPESGALLEKSANLKAYLARHMTRPSVREALPQQTPADAVRAAQQANATRAA
jgi:glutathione S-transferase